MHVFNSPDLPYLLYADDDYDDLQLLEEKLKEIDPSILMQGCSDGQEAFAALESIDEGNRLPDLIILDLNMPKWNGFKTLEVIKTNELYQDIPVVVFSNSDHPDHLRLSLLKGANDFLKKPYDLTELTRICFLLAGYLDGPARFKNKSTSLI